MIANAVLVFLMESLCYVKYFALLFFHCICPTADFLLSFQIMQSYCIFKRFLIFIIIIQFQFGVFLVTEGGRMHLIPWTTTLSPSIVNIVTLQSAHSTEFVVALFSSLKVRFLSFCYQFSYSLKNFADKPWLFHLWFCLKYLLIFKSKFKLSLHSQ